MRVVRSLVPILRDGGVVILPTDTIYGISARFDEPEARRRIRALKGHEDLAPLLALVSGFEMAFRHAEPPQGICREVLLGHWPGPLTAVLRARSHVPTEFCGPADTLAFRWPSSPFLQALLGALAVPLLSTSANRTGAPTPASFEEVVSLFPHGVDAFVDGGDLRGSGSTIVDLTGADPVVLRAGSVSL